MKQPRWRRERGFTLIEMMIVVAIIGILAAVAIPAFLKYIQRSKTTEGRTMLEKMYNGARTYYLETFGAQSHIVRHQFPRTNPLTPAVTCCEFAGRKCPGADPNGVEDWSSPTWVALNFGMDDPHYYRYEFISGGVSTASTFTARAVGDLDCDGDEAVFEILGRIGESGEPQGTGVISRNNELE